MLDVVATMIASLRKIVNKYDIKVLHYNIMQDETIPSNMRLHPQKSQMQPTRCQYYKCTNKVENKELCALSRRTSRFVLARKISPLRCAPVEMTGVRVAYLQD